MVKLGQSLRVFESMGVRAVSVQAFKSRHALADMWKSGGTHGARALALHPSERFADAAAMLAAMPRRAGKEWGLDSEKRMA